MLASRRLINVNIFSKQHSFNDLDMQIEGSMRIREGTKQLINNNNK